MRAPTSSRIVYVVQIVGWTFNDQWYYRDGMEDDSPFVAYTSRSQAEAELLYFDREKWADECPFQYGPNVESISHLCEAEFVTLIESLGLTPPAIPEWGQRDWLDWWDGVEEQLTPEQREAIWRAASRVKLHEIIEVELEG